MTQKYIYSELPEVVDLFVAKRLREAFSFYLNEGHFDHVVGLDRACGSYRHIVAALSAILEVIQASGGSLMFVTRRRDLLALLSVSRLGLKVPVYPRVDAAVRAGIVAGKAHYSRRHDSLLTSRHGRTYGKPGSGP